MCEYVGVNICCRERLLCRVGVNAVCEILRVCLVHANLWWNIRGNLWLEVGCEAWCASLL